MIIEEVAKAGSSAFPSNPFQMIVLASLISLAILAVESGPTSNFAPEASSSKSSAT